MNNAETAETVLKPKLDEKCAPYKAALAAQARRVVALHLTGVPVAKDFSGIPPEAAAAPAGSRIGGPALVTDNYPWPVDADDHPMTHLAQLNLAELPQLGGYPDSGLLQFFIADDDALGFNYEEKPNYRGFVARLIPTAELTAGTIAVTPTTDDYPFDGGFFTVTGQLYDQLPNPSDHKFEQAGLPLSWLDEDPDVEHCCGVLHDELPATILGPGWAKFTQDDPREEDTDLQLLFQLDWENHHGVQVMFGDAGVANFFITPTDLATQNFDNVFYSWDCC